MADKKISQLANASTPLAGTEVLPIVQGGSTVKVSINNLTDGKQVPAKDFYSFNTAGTNNYYGYSSGGAVAERTYANLAGFTLASYQSDTAPRYTKTTDLVANADAGAAGELRILTTLAGNTPAVAGKFTYNGNYAPVAGKGIDFSANANAPGMTSELLTWYEEGTWTPNQGAGLVVTGSFSSTGTYTRIGRQVTVRGTLSGSTNIAANAVGVMCSNLPFASAADTPGNYFNGSVTSGGQIDAAASSIYAVGAIAATNTIYFSVTYFV